MHYQNAVSSPISSPYTAATTSEIRKARRRGSYNCGRCGQPKRGHVCHLTGPNLNPNGTDSTDSIDSMSIGSPTFPSPLLPSRNPNSNLRRALSFDEDNESGTDGEGEGEDGEGEGEDLVDDESGIGLPVGILWEILARLPPTMLLSAAKVSRGWRDCTRRVWKAAEELKLVVPVNSQIGFVGSVLQKCSKLVRLSLSMESDVDATMLACIAFSCPNLESLEIEMLDKAINRITGDELGRFIADKRCLSSLKIEGCSNLGHFNICSSSLLTLWLSNLYSLSKAVINCPNLTELSLDFIRQESDSTNLVTMVDGFGQNCRKLRNIHIASVRLSNAVVLALADAHLSGLRKLSLVLGEGITDASVAAISSSYTKLELLDLSGSSISDGGIGMICNELAKSLSRLLLALCPNITSSGIQFATAQLPLLEVMDCGMTLCDPNTQTFDEDDGSNDSSSHEPSSLEKTPNSKLHLIYQKLIVKHLRLKKLSLWGCSGLDALYLNCPELNDLNLNSCTNLHPERLLLQCPNLKSVHASGCQTVLVRAIKSQVSRKLSDVNNDSHYPFKRLADGSKRIRVPNYMNQQTPDFEKKKKARVHPPCNVYVQ